MSPPLPPLNTRKYLGEGWVGVNIEHSKCYANRIVSSNWKIMTRINYSLCTQCTLR